MRIRTLSSFIALSSAAALGLSATPTFATQSSRVAVIRVEQVGGFVGPNVLTARLPEVVLYADGRVLVPGNLHGSIREIYQGSITMKVLQSQIARFSKAIKVPIGGWGIPGVSDLPTAQVSLLQKGKKKSVAVYALGFSRGDLTAGQIAARSYLTKSIAQLIALASKSRIYKPTQYEAWPIWPIPELSPAPTPDPAANLWPTEVAPPIKGCLVVPEKPFTALLNQTSSNEWVLPSGQRISATWRPVLPDEPACKR